MKNQMFGNTLFNGQPAYHSALPATDFPSCVATTAGRAGVRITALLGDGTPHLGYNATMTVTVNPGIPGIAITGIWDCNNVAVSPSAVPMVGGAFFGFIAFSIPGSSSEVGFIADASNADCTVFGQSMAFYWLVP